MQHLAAGTNKVRPTYLQQEAKIQVEHLLVRPSAGKRWKAEEISPQG